jgi:TolA-binding protein
METITLLVVINLVGLLGLAVLVLTRKSTGTSVDISKDLQVHRDELRSAIAANHDIVEKRLTSFSEASQNSAKLQRDEAGNSRVELQKSLNESLRNIETKIAELTDSNAKKQQQMQRCEELEQKRV